MVSPDLVHPGLQAGTVMGPLTCTLTSRDVQTSVAGWQPVVTAVALLALLDTATGR